MWVSPQNFRCKVSYKSKYSSGEIPTLSGDPIMGSPLNVGISPEE